MSTCRSAENVFIVLTTWSEEALCSPCIFPSKRWSNSEFVNRSLFLDLPFWPWIPLYNSLLFLLWICFFAGKVIFGMMVYNWYWCMQRGFYIYSLYSHLFYIITTKIQPTCFQFSSHVYICFSFLPIIKFFQTHCWTSRIQFKVQRCNYISSVCAQVLLPY